MSSAIFAELFFSQQNRQNRDVLLMVLSLRPSVLQLHISVSPEKVKLNVDCQEVAEKPIKEANNISLDGYEVLGKLVKSAGGRRQSATVSAKRLSCLKQRRSEKTNLQERLTSLQQQPFLRFGRTVAF